MAFLGIKIQPDIARLFRELEIPDDGKVPENEYHITILCFEDGLPIKDISSAMEATYEVTKDFKPFKVTTSEVTCFPGGPNGVPVISKIVSKELQELRDKLAKSFNKFKVDFDKKFKEYRPHITLAYAEKDLKKQKFDKIEFLTSEIVLWGGDHGDDKLFITFPLKAPGPKKKTSYLEQKAEIFCKLSSKN